MFWETLVYTVVIFVDKNKERWPQLNGNCAVIFKRLNKYRTAAYQQQENPEFRIY